MPIDGTKVLSLVFSYNTGVILFPQTTSLVNLLRESGAENVQLFKIVQVKLRNVQKAKFLQVNDKDIWQLLWLTFVQP